MVAAPTTPVSPPLAQEYMTWWKEDECDLTMTLNEQCHCQMKRNAPMNWAVVEGGDRAIRRRTEALGKRASVEACTTSLKTPRGLSNCLQSAHLRSSEKNCPNLLDPGVRGSCNVGR